ncbi:hypothetical protein [Chryseobacterium piscicola]|uniref:hypothetical protein n=1 Tax=Chryseobacterium piscicola TaxID=551459 RepID=UPI001E413771|nr:hypothetical protein [Chryseobacterium piscicola]
MAALFDVNVPAISKHLSNIFDENELSLEAIISILETVQLPKLFIKTPTVKKKIWV